MSKGNMKGSTYYLETFGCQMNILDSELIEGQLRARGMTPLADISAADVILFNTCSVRQHAEDRVHSRLGLLRAHKQKRPETIIGVLGCMAEREKEGIFVRAPHVDFLCGPGELNQISGLLDEVWERHERVAALAGSMSRRTEVLQRALEYDSLESLDVSRKPADDQAVLQSYIRVQRGCDKFCTYCVVPFTRGAERSRPPGHVVDEAKMLAERGCREITLLGQTVNSYVYQEDGEAVPFAKLLERLHAVERIDRIRFVTSFPADWDEDIFRVMRDFPRVMPYLHIPAQSGSDRILKGMKRGYTVAEYLKLMETARKYVPDIALAGDMIVGFCGETEDDYRKTVELTERVDYAGLFVFKYSPRPGTKADRSLGDDVSVEVKSRRNNELLAVQREIALRRKQTLVGETVEVLVEGLSKTARKALGETKGRLRTRGKNGLGISYAPPMQESEQDRGSEVLTTGRRLPSEGTVQLVGRTPQDMIALFDAPPASIGSIVRVRIDRASPYSLFGQLDGVVSPPQCVRSDPHADNVALPVLTS